MSSKTAQVSERLRCPPAAAFDALADAGKITPCWLASASTSLGEGSVSEWRFRVPGVKDGVAVTPFDLTRRRAVIGFEHALGVHGRGRRMDPRGGRIPRSRRDR